MCANFFHFDGVISLLDYVCGGIFGNLVVGLCQIFILNLRSLETVRLDSLSTSHEIRMVFGLELLLSFMLVHEVSSLYWLLPETQTKCFLEEGMLWRRHYRKQKLNIWLI